MGDAGGGQPVSPLPPYDGQDRPPTGTGSDLPPTNGGNQPPRDETGSGVSTGTRNNSPRPGGTKKTNVGSGLNM
jgi:hypothetical protein